MLNVFRIGNVFKVEEKDTWTGFVLVWVSCSFWFVCWFCKCWRKLALSPKLCVKFLPYSQDEGLLSAKHL